MVKVPVPFLTTEIDAFRQMADAAGIAKLYVKGAPQELHEPTPPAFSGPWPRKPVLFQAFVERA